MTCPPVLRPTPQQLFDQYANMFQTTVLGGAQLVPESNEWYAVSLHYAAAEQFYAVMNQVFKEADPRTACEDNLIKMAEENGVFPRPAIPAQGYVRITGPFNAPLPVPMEFTIGTEQFTTAFNPGQPTSITNNGDAVVRIAAVVPGVSGNINEETGVIDTAVGPGINTTVEVLGCWTCGGQDAETIEQFRARYIRRLAYQPRATQSWMLDKLLEWPCATRALVRAGSCCGCNCENVSGPGGTGNCADCGCQDCGGQMRFYVMLDNTFPHGVAPPSVIREIEEWMFGSPQGMGIGEVEIGICGGIHVVRPVSVNLTVTIEDCVTPSKQSQVEGMVREFMSTLVPSAEFSFGTLQSSIQAMLGTTATITYEFVNPFDSSLFRSTPCFIEPLCDHLMVLDSVTVNSYATNPGECR